MSAATARSLKAVDGVEVTVLVDNVVDPLSTQPAGVAGENAILQANAQMVSSGHVRCCANHGLSLVITARVGKDIRILLFDAGPEAYTLARNVFGDIPLYGVMGGFHLAGAEVEAVIPETIRDMRTFDLKRIVPCHCTGWRALHALAQVYDEQVLAPAAVGRRFVF